MVLTKQNMPKKGKKQPVQNRDRIVTRRTKVASNHGAEVPPEAPVEDEGATGGQRLTPQSTINTAPPSSMEAVDIPTPPPQTPPPPPPPPPHGLFALSLRQLCRRGWT